MKIGLFRIKRHGFDNPCISFFIFILSKLNEMIDPRIEREESFQINIKDRIFPNNRNGMPVHKYNKRDLPTNMNMMLFPGIEYVSRRPIPDGVSAFSSQAQGSAAHKIECKEVAR